MNSEELEQSLRTEFEGYLKNVLADMKQEVSLFQQKMDTELEKHKSHLDEVFQEFSERIQTDRKLDEGFKDSVVEHLRLARDEGARITATAIAEAEELTKAEKSNEVVTVPSIEFGDIRDAINDISSQNSQSAILKSLINHAAKFTPRGAFFVVKNQHFVGWRVFGKQNSGEDDAITEIIFPVSAQTILGESVKSLSVIESNFGTFVNDSDYLTQLDFGQPETMFAIPLIARGRGVAAIYADNGDDTEKVNVEALETLVSVAGLTVELLAAAQNSNYTREPVKTTSYVAQVPAAAESQESVEESNVAPAETYAPVESYKESEPEEAVEEVAAVSEETSEQFTPQYEEETSEFSAEQEEKVEESESFYQRDEEPASYPSYFEESKSEESYASVNSEVQEIEVEEPVEESTYEEPKTEEETVYEVSDLDTPSISKFESLEYDSEEPKTEETSEVEETYNFSREEVTESETSAPDFSAYDDDLIEEVQAQTEEPEQAEISEPVYEETPAVETQPAEDEVDTVETLPPVETESYFSNQPDEAVEEVSDNYVMDSGSQSEEEVHEVETAETEETADKYATGPLPQYPEFETNQDFNQIPVQFEETAEKIEEEVLEEKEAEEVSFTPVETLETVETAETAPIEATAPVETVQVEEPSPVSEPAPVAAPPVRTRFSDRNVDLPIEVSEEERRLHNDARRFARLLVSEIKLYNEQKVKEGRDANDLYERLREAIDRSREMYDKRVQPVVVERFDYFHYEVVNTLAEGEEAKLGSSYPGATVQ